MATAREGIASRVPAGLLARVAEDADLERMVDFDNRFADPVQWTSPSVAREFERSNPQPNRLALVVEREGEIVAQGQTSDGGLWAAPDKSWRLGLRVAPEWRRNGVGRVLAKRLEEHARDKGAGRLVVAIHGSEPEGLAFASALGYAEFHRRIDSYIDVPSFDASSFDDPDDLAGRVGVRLATYADLLREHSRDLDEFQRTLLAAFWEWARDVPSPTPMPARPPSLEQARRMFLEGPGIDPGTTIMAMRGDTPVGVTATMVKENGVAYTNFTGVARAERRKGLALAMKLRALRALGKRAVRLFGTTNDEANAAMRGVNARLGYVPQPPTIMVEKRFTS